MTRIRTARLAPVLASVLAVLAGARVVTAQDTARRTGEAWQIIPLPQSSLVFARDGSPIGEIGREMRTNVPIRSLPKYVGQAFVAVEDQRFYQHDGVDVIGVLGALKGKVMRENRGGASTITQQLVGYMHPDIIDRREISGTAGISRKLHEQAAAREMERHYTKEKILEAYINQINLGRGWYGVDAGSRHYFGHPAAQLTIAEAATLAALPKSQPTYDPIAQPDSADDGRSGLHHPGTGYSDEGRADGDGAQPGHVRGVRLFRRRCAPAGRTSGNLGDQRRVPRLHNARSGAAA